MPIAISILLLVLAGMAIALIIRNAKRNLSRKESWLAHLNVDDKARVVIPDDQIIFGKVTKIDAVYYTVEYKVKKEFIHPPFK